MPSDDEEREPVYYCPHGVEVDWPGQACDLCADEDADDSDDSLVEHWNDWLWKGLTDELDR